MDKKLACLIDSALKHADMKQAENGVLYLGLTRAGKSSLVAQQIGCELEYYDDGVSLIEPVQIVCCPEVEAPTIGDKPKAHTLFPHGYIAQDDVHIDFPGFDGSRGDEEMLGVLSTQVALSSLGHIRHVVVVIDYADIGGKNARNLARVFESLSLLVQDMERHRADITLVVSKVQNIIGKTVGAQKARVVRALKEFDEVLAAGNYQSQISNLDKVRQFIRLFTGSEGYDNMVLFHADDQTRQELAARIHGGKGVSPGEVGFLADKSHADEFYGAIKGELDYAIPILEFLHAYPNRYRDLARDIQGDKSSVEAIMKKLIDLEGHPPKLVFPHSEKKIKDNYVQKFTFKHHGKKTVIRVHLHRYPKLVNEARALGSLQALANKYAKKLRDFGVTDIVIETDVIRMQRENDDARTRYNQAREQWVADIERLKHEEVSSRREEEKLANLLADLRAKYTPFLVDYCINKDMWLKLRTLNEAIRFDSELYEEFSWLFGEVSSQVDALECERYPSPVTECHDYAYADSAQYPICQESSQSCPEAAFAVWPDTEWRDSYSVVDAGGDCLPASFVSGAQHDLPSVVPVALPQVDTEYTNYMYGLLSLFVCVALLKLFSWCCVSTRSQRQCLVSTVSSLVTNQQPVGSKESKISLCDDYGR